MPQARSETSLGPPAVYDFAVCLAELYGCSRILELNCGRVSWLDRKHKEMEVLGVDSTSNIAWRRDHCPDGEWIAHDFDQGPLESIERSKVGASLVLCTGWMERMADRAHVLATLQRLLEDSPVAILNASGCDAQDAVGASVEEAGNQQADKPPGRTGVGGSRLDARNLLENAGLEVLFDGQTFSGEASLRKSSLLSVVRQPRKVVTPPDFRVVALVGAYNEEDIIEPFLQHTIGQGVEVFLLDNWSTDRTAERAAQFLGKGLSGIAKFPEDGPTATHEWFHMLQRKEELAHRMNASWFLHLDPDELRESPWRDVTLRQALYRVEAEGFNAINHTCIVFHPITGAAYREDLLIEPQFPYFEFGSRPGHFAQIRGWKRQPEPVHLAESGGHDASFQGRRVYPFRFLLKHYPIRSQEHGERKVFRERLPRFSAAARERGWHTQYDKYLKNDSFVRDRSTLLRFTPGTFHEEYVVERLTGIGIRRA